MKATLTTKLTVHAITIFAEMAWLEDRPELGALCKAARDSNNRLTKDIIQKTLLGVSDHGANNILDQCKLLGLTDSNGHLSELGQSVADTNRAPVPEQGVYNLWITEHPLLKGTSVLAAERHAQKQNATNMNSSQLKKLPLQLPINRAFQSLANPQEEFLIRALPHQHDQPECVINSARQTAHLVWHIEPEPASSQWQLHGGLTTFTIQESLPIQDNNHLEPVNPWDLMNHWARHADIRDIGSWNSQKQYIVRDFDQLTPEEYLSFAIKEIQCFNINVPNKGRFDTLTLNNVPLGPKSEQDAREWANGLLLHKLTHKSEFRTRQNVKQLFEDCIESTPLAEFSPTLPAHKDLLQELGLQQKTPAAFWSIAAPVDLAFTPVTDEELAEQTFQSSTSTTQTGNNHDRFIIPYKANWSMGNLVSKLLQGTTPKRILLCDRYVVGHSNLNALKLFVDALHTHSPSTQVEVWTRSKDADLQKITNITGTKPRAYEDLFGKDNQHPHDRYILIQPDDGEGFIWNLSNSPLHAKAPPSTTPTSETPLQWKDLVANKFDADQFDPQMKQWLKGAQ